MSDHPSLPLKGEGEGGDDVNLFNTFVLVTILLILYGKEVNCVNRECTVFSRKSYGIFCDLLLTS